MRQVNVLDSITIRCNPLFSLIKAPVIAENSLQQVRVGTTGQAKVNYYPTQVWLAMLAHITYLGTPLTLLYEHMNAPTLLRTQLSKGGRKYSTMSC
jgi:hypothetical protein